MVNNFFSQCPPPLTCHDCLRLTIPDKCPEDVLCSQDEMVQFLEPNDVSKSNGPDKISGRMLKATALSNAPSINKVFNLSIKLGCVPQTWKMLSNPTFGDRASPTNYKPISLPEEVCQGLNYRISAIRRRGYYLFHPAIFRGH